MEPNVDPSEDPTDSGTSMLDGSDIVARLAAAEERLAAHARAEKPEGLTEPDPGGTERWEAAQVWGHVAEFVGYWHEQIQTVIAAYDGDPVPFGRTKEDAGRLAGIEMGLHAPIPESMNRVRDAIGDLRRYLEGLTSAEWNAVGRHSTRGELDVEAIVEGFIVGHLEEHAEQLDGLRSAS
jgi:DinB superfamily